MDNGTCVDCAAETRRSGRSGPHPKRCDDCASVHKRAGARRRTAKYRESNPGAAAREKASYAAWYAKNAEDQRAKALDWYRSNRSRAAETNARWYRENVDKSRAKTQSRRAVSRGVHADRISPREVYDRDEWFCGICGESIDSSLSYPHPKSVSLDHVVPISKGGAHTFDNVRAAHWLCNTRRGARVEE